MPIYRRFISGKEYVKACKEVVPPFIIFQPFVVRNGVEGYMIPCEPNHPKAEKQ